MGAYIVGGRLLGRWTNIFLLKLLKRINSSCSSGYERRKSVEWDEWTINAAAHQGNLEMVKYCVANECPIDAEACAYAATNGHLEYSNTYAKKSKRLGIGELPLGRLKWSSPHTRISC